MKAILTDDVSGTGYRGEHVEIRGGFMRNFLFPAKRAIYATDENRRMYEAVDRVSAVGAAPSQGGRRGGGLVPSAFRPQRSNPLHFAVATYVFRR